MANRGDYQKYKDRGFDDYDFDDDFRRNASKKGSEGGLKRKRTFFNSKKSAGGSCSKNMFKLARKIFTNMYPKKLKPALTPEGQWLRKCVGWAVVLHILFFTFCLAFVGFLPMITNLFLAAFSYSVFLTLRECQVIVYIVMLLGALCEFYSNLFYHEDMDSTQRMGLLAMMMAIAWMTWVAGNAYYWFRKSGGIKGFRRDSGLLPEEKLAK